SWGEEAARRLPHRQHGRRFNGDIRRSGPSPTSVSLHLRDPRWSISEDRSQAVWWCLRRQDRRRSLGDRRNVDSGRSQSAPGAKAGKGSFGTAAEDSAESADEVAVPNWDQGLPAVTDEHALCLSSG